MALIICSECGREISDKAKACIHCGNPIGSAKNTDLKDSSSQNKIIINNREISKDELVKILELALKLSPDRKTMSAEHVTMLSNLTGLSFKNAGNAMAYLLGNDPSLDDGLILGEDGNVADSYVLGKKTPTAVCPNCGSDNIQIVQQKYSLFTGFLTNKTKRVCVNCNTSF